MKPKWLTGEAAKVWRQVIAQLESMGTLAKTDGAAIARYCDLMVRYVTASAFIAKYGESYPLKDDQGRVKCFQPFPQSTNANKLAVLLLRLEQEFGLTPASRANLRVTAQDQSAPKVSSRQRWTGAS